MGRPAGARNAGYDERKQAIVASVTPLVLGSDGALPSLRQLAEAADVSVPTLRHYFTSAEGVAAEVLASMRRLGEAHMQRGRVAHLGPLEPSMRWYLSTFRTGWELGVGRVFACGLALGLGNDVTGPAFVNEILEPSLRTLEVRLEWHETEGHLVAGTDLRVAALALLGPVALALLHQGPLGGDRCRPLDVDAYVEAHLTGFLRAYGRCEGL